VTGDRAIKALTFDTFGTVVDWRSSIASGFADLADKLDA